MQGLQEIRRELMFVALVLATVPSANGQCVNSNRGVGAFVGYDKVQLVPSGVPSSLMTALQAGMETWNDTDCNTDGSSFPKFVLSAATGARVITVAYQEGLGPRSDSCGNFGGNIITLYSVAIVDGRSVPCTIPNQFQDTVSHELGHVLGLGHINSSNCPNHIMSERQVSPSGTYTDRRVQDDECQKVDETNLTPAERTDPCAGALSVAPARGRVTARALIPCDDGGEGGGPGGGDDPSVTNSGSPILIDLDRSGFELTDLAGGVRFDLNRDGWAEMLSWTAAGSGDAWLVLDRNSNGVVDDGGELFGDWTDQPATDQPHGYLALSIFDQPAHGGNGNGRIDHLDGEFDELRLWVDSNHDGHSQIGELLTLNAAGVRWISLNAVESRRRDRYGNEFRYRSVVRLWVGMTQSYDVFLLVEP